MTLIGSSLVVGETSPQEVSCKSKKMPSEHTEPRWSALNLKGLSGSLHRHLNPCTQGGKCCQSRAIAIYTHFPQGYTCLHKGRVRASSGAIPHIHPLAEMDSVKCLWIFTRPHPLSPYWTSWQSGLKSNVYATGHGCRSQAASLSASSAFKYMKGKGSLVAKLG